MSGQPRTLHWFFSLGTDPRAATYVLARDLDHRLRPYFPQVRPAAPAPHSPIAADSKHSARSVTAALLHLLGAPQPGVTVRFHLLPTKELFQPTKDGPPPFEALVHDAPAWARGALRAASGADPAERAAEEKIDLVGRAVDRILGEAVGANDLVLIETTNGMRTLTIGMLLAHSILRATRPDVEVVAATYGELIGWPSAPGAALSPVYDLTDLLDLPRWATAAESLRRRFDVRPLAELLQGSDPRLAESLDDVASALDLGWPGDLIDPLNRARAGLASIGKGSPGRAPVLSRVEQGLSKLTAGVPSGVGPLDVTRLKYHLTIAQTLVEASRYGDAIRVLREAMVDAAVLAGAASGSATDWRDPKTRERAAGRLFRAHLPLWEKVSELRNAASHAKSSERHDEAGDPAKLVRALRGDPTTPGLVRQVWDLVIDQNSMKEGWIPTAAPTPPVWYRTTKLPHPCAAAVESALKEYTAKSLPAPLRIPGAPPVPTHTPAGTAPKTVHIKGDPKHLRSPAWSRGKAREARGAVDAVLDLQALPIEESLLAAELRDTGVRPWAFRADPSGDDPSGYSLWPLFTTQEQAWG